MKPAEKGDIQVPPAPFSLLLAELMIEAKLYENIGENIEPFSLLLAELMIEALRADYM